MQHDVGLVITGGYAPSGPVRIATERRCLIVAADSGLEHAARWGIVPHAIVGDMDSLTDLSLIQNYTDSVVERYDTAKDKTDTEIALDFVWKRGVNRVTIVGGGGGRLDHLMGILSIFERDRYPTRWVTDRDEVTVLDSTHTFACARGEVVSFFPVGRQRCTMRTEGLRWPLDELVWERGDVGVSNECMAESCRVEMSSGRLLMVRALRSPVLVP